MSTARVIILSGSLIADLAIVGVVISKGRATRKSGDASEPADVHIHELLKAAALMLFVLGRGASLDNPPEFASVWPIFSLAIVIVFAPLIWVAVQSQRELESHIGSV